MKANKAYIHEIFSGIQGEGPFVGARQIFVRLCECNLTCRFCDTPASQNRAETCRVERTPGKRDFEEIRNPIDVPQLVEAVARLNRFLHHSLALTGGEPLVQADFLAEVLPFLQVRLPIYLETNGTLPEALKRVLDNINIIAMDIKLPSATGDAGHFPAHKEFLPIAVQRGKDRGEAGEVFVKMVITADTLEEELVRAFSLVAEIDPNIEVVLQPVSELMTTDDSALSSQPPRAPDPLQVLQWQQMGLKRLAFVRVIPQMHRLMGQL